MNAVRRFATLTIPLLIAAASVVAAPGDVGKWRAGVDFQLVHSASPPAKNDRVEVREVFWYGCGHCFALDPALEAWDAKKAKYIDFVRVPVIWGPMHRQHAKLFYVMEALGKMDLHPNVFHAIHRERLPLADRDEVKAREMHFEFLSRHGVTREQFDAAYDSMPVINNLRRAEDFTRDFRVESVPTIFVNRRYSTGVTEAGGPTQLIALINDLAASEKNR